MTQCSRRFSLLDADGERLEVVASLSPGRDGLVFTLDSHRGPYHEAILDAAPDDVADDLVALSAMSGRGTDGRPHDPMRAALDLYRGRVHDALAHLGGAATLDEMIAVSDGCARAFADRDAPLFADAEAAAVDAARDVAARNHEMRSVSPTTSGRRRATGCTGPWPTSTARSTRCPRPGWRGCPTRGCARRPPAVAGQV